MQNWKICTEDDFAFRIITAAAYIVGTEIMEKGADGQPAIL